MQINELYLGRIRLSNYIQWKKVSEDKPLELYIYNSDYPNGINYQSCQTPGIKKPDYDIPNGSKGYATMQNCLKRGYTYLKTE